jgi:trans-2,3-dihydro-3-hydroxyanthranilate isomerase
MSPLRYELCDVFTDRALAGNALAVFTDASGIDDITMQALAREMNLSESAFVLRPIATDADVRVRIFTPTMELPFAGHPILGTAFVLAKAKQEGAAIRLETGRGIVTVRVAPSQTAVRFGWMTQPIPVWQPFEAADELLAALHVNRSTLPIELYDNGPRYVLVQVETAAEVARLGPDLSRLAAFGSIAFVVFARQAASWKVRVFAPGEGIVEDPATGAAAGALAVHLCRHGQISFGDEVIIEQGVEIARPSKLHARAVGSAERLDRVEVGGNGVVVASGEFDRSLVLG